jgi:hypothetical protein
MTFDLLADGWVPAACTLTTVERPVRSAEFDRLFADDVLAIHRETPRRLRLELRPDPQVVSRAAGLAVKETGCCSFFAFDLRIADGSVSLGIETSGGHEGVLAALGAHAEAQLGTAL